MVLSHKELRLSIVIPVYGSEAILPELVQQLGDVLSRMDELAGEFEVLFICDASPDNSWSVICGLINQYGFVRGVKLRKNAGQHNAIMAGLRNSRGAVILTMDDDLQHSPHDIPLIYRKIAEGYDVCYAKFQKRHHTWWKVGGSWLNDMMARFLLDKPKGLYLSPFKAFRREIGDEMVKYYGPYVYLDGLILSVTQSIATVDVEHHDRLDGESGYSLRKSISLWLKMATSFSIVPLRLASALGVLFAGLGFLAAILLVIQRFTLNLMPIGWSSLIVAILIMGGVQLLALGAIGEYLGRILLSINNKPQYVIAEIAAPSSLDSCEPPGK